MRISFTPFWSYFHILFIESISLDCFDVVGFFLYPIWFELYGRDFIVCAVCRVYTERTLADVVHPFLNTNKLF